MRMISDNFPYLVIGQDENNDMDGDGRVLADDVDDNDDDDDDNDDDSEDDD